ncbi:MAG: LysR family transcriptional regulator ArgP [Sulfitobacter sp.]|nr:LysR family transcriptional regulator ArgP [Sulfitobacter sp.]
MSLDPLQLAALSAILRQGSFEAAAGVLNVTPSAISQRLKALEERVGATLVNRTNPATATEKGARLAKFAEDLALLEAQALGEVSAAYRPAPRLTLAVPADSLATWLIPALAGAPNLLFDLRIDDQDTSGDWLRRGTVSAAVTGTARPAPGCDSHALGALRYVATANPDFLDRHFGKGVTIRALARAPVVTFSEKDQLQHRWLRQITGKALHPPSHQLASTHGFIDAALHGLGWCMNPLSLVQPDIEAGRLVLLAENEPLDTPLYWQVSRLMAPALADLTRRIRSEARAKLLPLP